MTERPATGSLPLPPCSAWRTKSILSPTTWRLAGRQTGVTGANAAPALLVAPTTDDTHDDGAALGAKAQSAAGALPCLCVTGGRQATGSPSPMAQCCPCAGRRLFRGAFFPWRWVVVVLADLLSNVMPRRSAPMRGPWPATLSPAALSPSYRRAEDVIGAHEMHTRSR